MNPTESEQLGFDEPPEALHPIHMDSTSDKFIPAMSDSEMLAIAHIDQTVIPAPAIRVDDTVQRDLAANNCLQRGVPAVGNKFRVDLPMALENAKDDRFAGRSSASFSFHAARPKVRFLDFDLAPNGDWVSQNSAIRSRRARTYRLTVLRFTQSGEPFVRPLQPRPGIARVGEIATSKFEHGWRTDFPLS